MKSRVVIAREVIAGYWGSGDKRVADLKVAGYNPEVVQGDVNTLLCCRENIIGNMKAMAVFIADNNNWWYIKYNEQFGKECAICHPHDGKNHGWQCIGFCMAVWHHAVLPIPCNCGVIGDDTWEAILHAKTDAEALKIARNHLKINDIEVIRNKNGIPKSKAQAGDMASYFINGDDYQHTYFIMSSTKVADATTQSPKANNIRADRSFSGRYVNNMKVIIRYTGNGLCPPPQRTIDELAYEVIADLWGSGDSRAIALTQAGHDYNAVQKRVNEILNPQPTPPTPTPPKETTLVAVDVINGDYGNGTKREAALRKKGYDPVVIQNEVNRLMTESKKKSIDTLAHEVIDGYWRSGKKREKVLKACGCDYDAIQRRVNEILNPGEGYKGKFPDLHLVKTNAEVIEDAIQFGRWIAYDNDFHYGYGEAAHKCGCYFCGTQPVSKKNAGIKMWEHSQCCNPFVTSCFAHGGCILDWLKVDMRGGAYDWNSMPNVKDFKRVYVTPQAGDVLCSDGHMALSLGGTKVIHASGGDDNIIHSKSWNNSIREGTWSGYNAIYRYVGSVDVIMPLRFGEVSDRVADLQNFLNWYGNYGLNPDREFGDKTLAAFKDFQSKEGLVADGVCGIDSINRMKQIVR